MVQTIGMPGLCIFGNPYNCGVSKLYGKVFSLQVYQSLLIALCWLVWSLMRVQFLPWGFFSLLE